MLGKSQVDCGDEEHKSQNRPEAVTQGVGRTAIPPELVMTKPNATAVALR